jgi:hypothetical protein
MGSYCLPVLRIEQRGILSYAVVPAMVITVPRGVGRPQIGICLYTGAVVLRIDQEKGWVVLLVPGQQPVAGYAFKPMVGWHLKMLPPGCIEFRIFGNAQLSFSPALPAAEIFW